jgi:hypothetical protein
LEESLMSEEVAANVEEVDAEMITISDDQFEVRYRAARGCRLSTADAERIGPELVRLKNENGGVITKNLVLQSATSPISILHQDFEWDDATAANTARLDQAGYMLRSIMIVWDERNDTGDTVEREFRMFHHVNTTAEPAETVTEARQQPQSIPGYVTFPDVVASPDYSAQVIADAENHLQRFTNKYHAYLDQIPAFAERFRSVFDALQTLDE